MHLYGIFMHLLIYIDTGLMLVDLGSLEVFDGRTFLFFPYHVLAVWRVQQSLLLPWPLLGEKIK